MKANNIKEAWAMADEIFPTDYMKDDQTSANAGYPIYRSTLDANCTDNYQPWYCQIADLGCRLEVTVTLASWEQKVINIWIEAPAEETAAVEAPTEEGAPQGLSAISPERKELVLRLRRATFAYTREYLDELANKRQNEAGVGDHQHKQTDCWAGRCADRPGIYLPWQSGGNRLENK